MRAAVIPFPAPPDDAAPATGPYLVDGWALYLDPWMADCIALAEHSPLTIYDDYPSTPLPDDQPEPAYAPHLAIVWRNPSRACNPTPRRQKWETTRESRTVTP